MKTYKKKIICSFLLIVVIFTITNKIYALTCPACKGTGLLHPGSNMTCPNCNGTGEAKSSSSGQTSSHTGSEIIDEGNKFIEVGEKDSNDKIRPENLKKLSDTLYSILVSVGVVIAVIVGLVLGIKFIMGGIEEKAELKAMIIPYIIGCVVLFGSFTIWKIVVNILQSM